MACTGIASGPQGSVQVWKFGGGGEQWPLIWLHFPCKIPKPYSLHNWSEPSYASFPAGSGQNPSPTHFCIGARLCPFPVPPPAPASPGHTAFPLIGAEPCPHLLCGWAGAWTCPFPSPQGQIKLRSPVGLCWGWSTIFPSHALCMVRWCLLCPSGHQTGSAS